MVSWGGTVLRSLATFFYGIDFCCAGIILGVYSYFLAVLSDHNLPINNDWKAVEGMSGIAVIYSILAVLLTCFLGGVTIFAVLGLALDVLFCAAFIALAVLTRDGAGSCSGTVTTPLGTGPSNSQAQGYGADGFGFDGGETVTYFPNLGLACRLNTAAFAVSIIGAFFFLFSAVLQVFVARHHKKEKKYGPSPSNNYTSGSGNRRNFFRRNKKDKGVDEKADEQALPPTEPAMGGGREYNQMPATTAPTSDTGYTNSSVGQQSYELGPGKAEHSGYYTAPTGTGINPYGYDNSAPAKNF